MKPKIMQCEYGDNKGKYFIMRDSGHRLNSGLDAPIAEYLQSDLHWSTVAEYFGSEFTCKLLIEMESQRSELA